MTILTKIQDILREMDAVKLPRAKRLLVSPEMYQEISKTFTGLGSLLICGGPAGETQESTDKPEIKIENLLNQTTGDVVEIAEDSFVKPGVVDVVLEDYRLAHFSIVHWA